VANVFCSSTGSNTSPYETWAKAATTFATAIAAAGTGDIIAVDATNPPADIAADTTWTFVANCSVIASTNSGTSTITPTTMGTTTYLGASGATSYSVTLSGAFKVFFYGLTFRVAGTANRNISLAQTDGSHFEFENCYFWLGTTNVGPNIACGLVGQTTNAFVSLKNCTFRFGASGQGILTSSAVAIIGGSVSSAGTAPSVLFKASKSDNFQCSGLDVSHVGSGTLVGDNTSGSGVYVFDSVKLGSGMTILATQTLTSKAGAKVFVFDSASGDTHGLIGYYDSFGQIVSNTGTYLTAGAAAQSWQITTTANCSFTTPFVTPWIDFYSAAASAATYKLELLRNNGTATAYNDAQVWGEFSVKDNSGFTNSDIFSDRQSLSAWAAGTAGTAQTAGAGTGSWTIASSNSPASFVVDSGSAITQAENGAIRARVAVGQASLDNLFLDPQIRT
jgi:hypothetical protein